MDARRRAVLRQVARPPYLERWVALVVTTTVVVLLAGNGLAAVVGGDGRAEPVAVSVPAPRAPTAPTAPAVPAQVQTLTAAGGRTASLTFDDGPHPVTTPQVLDLLAQHGVPATFCTITHEAMEQWRLVRRIVADGHRLCDHTSDHDASLAAADAPAIAGAMRVSRAELAAAAGDPDLPLTLFRAPLGRWSPALQEAAASTGMRPLGWSVDTLDWTGVPAADVVAAVQRDLRDGGVVLMHDGGGDRTQTVAALRVLLPWLHEQGYRIVLPDDPPAAPGAGSPEPGGAG